MTLQRSLPVLEIRSQPQGRIDGYASVFNGIDSYGDSIAPGAYAKSLAAYKAKSAAPVMLWSHSHDAPIGRWLNLIEDARGLRVEGQLNLKTDAGQQAFEHLRAGDINGLSIGFSVPAGGSQSVNGMNVLSQIDLYEISIVSMPADPAARIDAVKHLTAKPVTKRDLEHALRGIGYSRNEAAHIVASGYAGVNQIEMQKSQELAEMSAALKSLTSLFKI